MSEIKYNLINSALAGGLVFAGTFADGNVTWEGIAMALGTSVIVALTKFRDWFKTQNPSVKVFMNFY